MRRSLTWTEDERMRQTAFLDYAPRLTVKPSVYLRIGKPNHRGIPVKCEPSGHSNKLTDRDPIN